MNIAFTTCVQLGKSCIEEIYKIGGKLELMITLKDEKARNKSGRIYLDELSAEHQVPLLKINHINDKEVLKAIQKYKIDWLFIIGWSQIAGSEILKAPTYGCIGMHPTLLPKGRGRASIPWAILKGLDRTGVTMFKLDEGVDTGDIIAQVEIQLDNKITAAELYQKVDEVHIQLIKENWNSLINNQIELKKQDNSIATEWPGRKPADGEILSTMSMEEAERLVRAVTHPYPGAFFKQGTEKIIIWEARVQEWPAEMSVGLSDGFLIPTDYEIVANEEITGEK